MKELGYCPIHQSFVMLDVTTTDDDKGTIFTCSKHDQFSHIVRLAQSSHPSQEHIT